MKPARALLAALVAHGLTAAAPAQTTTAPAAPAALPPAALAVHAAGSLRAALTEIARAFEREGGGAVRLTFAPSGLLKDRIAAGEPSEVFASANLTHPQALHDAGKAEPVQTFARNALCLLAAAGFQLQGRSVPQALLDPAVRVATSTPRADPAGDYAFELFDRIEAAGHAGAAATLKAKALQLTGGPNSAPAPAGRSAYGALMADGRAELFVTYCTNAVQARQEVPALQVLPVPAAINVAAAYGITVVRPATPAATAFVGFVFGPQGQRVLAAHGFSAP